MAAGEPTKITFGTDGWRAKIGDEFTFENVRRLAFGGMGEVFLACHDGEDPGAARHFVIKRVLNHMRRDEKQRRLFLDEARLQSRLVHPHVVGVEDVDQVGLDEAGMLGSRRVEFLGVLVADLRQEHGDPVPGGGVGRVVDEAEQCHEVADVGLLEEAHAAGDLVDRKSNV